jgi:hypothetical protein
VENFEYRFVVVLGEDVVVVGGLEVCELVSVCELMSVITDVLGVVAGSILYCLCDTGNGLLVYLWSADS